MKYFSVTKPGIIFGNIITATGGYFLGTSGQIHVFTYIAMLIGMSLVIASGCVYNNIIDRDIDQLMERTKNRVMPNGLIDPKVALCYATMLGILGLFILYFFTNPLTALIALIGLVIYVVVYSLCLKRHTTLGTAIGGISGAIPPIVGYCAITNNLDTGAIILFLILFFWQIPHSYAIAIYRLNDYKAAAIPVLPVKKGIKRTKISMLIFSIAFAIASILPTAFGYTGNIYLVISGLFGLGWFFLSLKGFFCKDNVIWARKMFSYSIVNITLISLLMIVK